MESFKILRMEEYRPAYAESQREKPHMPMLKRINNRK